MSSRADRPKRGKCSSSAHRLGSRATKLRIIRCQLAERALCRDVQVNFAYRWFCGLSIEDKVPDHSAFSRARNERFNSDIFRSVFETVSAARRGESLVPPY